MILDAMLSSVERENDLQRLCKIRLRKTRSSRHTENQLDRDTRDEKKVQD
jgi:hypothetical protein